MVSKNFREVLASGRILVADGATGTNLLARGLEKGLPAEQWVLEQPDKIEQLYKDFVSAGSDIILTCTFGGTSIRLEQAGLKDKMVEINQQAVALAKKAVAGNDVFIAGSIGPTGHLLKPLGPLEPEDALAAYSEQARVLTEAGVDLLIIETQYDLAEAELAIQAVKSVSDLPLICSFSYDRGVRTMFGVKPSQMGKRIGESGVDVVGINCGKSIEDNYTSLQELREVTSLPIWFKPNAGMPEVDSSGNSSYSVTPAQMGAHVKDWVAAGAQIVGGCCGTSPDHVKAIVAAAKKM